MIRNLTILLVLGVILALPFVFRQETGIREWKEGDPVLVVVTPMNEALRHEYAVGFSRWHAERYGTPVRIDWRAIGGTTEIMRYLQGQFTSAFRAWWTGQGRAWPAAAASALMATSFDPAARPDTVSEADWAEIIALRDAFRATDDPAAFTSGLDLCYGGGAYDAANATRMGMLVPVWDEGQIPDGLLRAPDGTELLPEGMGGETWRAPAFYGTALSTFGICWNRARMEALGIDTPPLHWSDLGDPRWAGTLGVADPTKSGSIAKAFETLVQVQCRRAVEAAGYTPEQIDAWEAALAAAGGDTAPDVPAAYEEAVERGWADGIRLIQRIGANARYFTDSANKVPLDVGAGNAAAGLCIDFYGRYEAETSNGGRPDGAMVYATPVGESGVSADPVMMLRGAPHKQLAQRLCEYVLGEEGQRLLCYRAGEPGGPVQYNLQRLPIRRDFYPDPDHPDIQAAFERHRPHTTGDLSRPELDAYALARAFTYRPRWTAAHFNFIRDFTRAMCIDSGAELRDAWRAIIAAGGPDACPAAMAALTAFPTTPEPLTFATARTIRSRHDREDLLRDWTAHYRRQYNEAARLAREEAKRRRP